MSEEEPEATLALLHTVAERVQKWNDAHNQGKPLFPPVTEAEVQAAEKRIGFSLPPFLRLVYTQVANGGIGIRQLRLNQSGYFAPESGLYGIAGGCAYGFELGNYQQLPEYVSGYGDRHIITKRRTIEDGVSHSGWHLYAEVEHRLMHESDASIAYDDENGDPDGWTWLYDTNCSACGHYMLDLHTGHIYSTRPDFDFPDLPIIAVHEFPSVEALFRSWLQ